MDLMAPARLFGRGELLFSQSQPVTALFILKSGRVRIFRAAEDGKALTMAVLEPGAVFGEMMLAGQRMYDNYAEAIEDAAICQLSVDEVERFLLSDPRIAIRISRLLGEQVAASKNASPIWRCGRWPPRWRPPCSNSVTPRGRRASGRPGPST